MPVKLHFSGMLSAYPRREAYLLKKYTTRYAQWLHNPLRAECVIDAVHYNISLEFFLDNLNNHVELFLMDTPVSAVLY
jgi:hypothetical protein